MKWGRPSSWVVCPLWFCLGAAGLAQDARSMIQRAIEVDRQGQELAQQYTYLQRTETRVLDGSGKVKSTHSRTTDVTRLEGSPYRRLVAIDDKPLPTKEQAKEEQKLRAGIEERRKETPQAREQRLADYRHRQDERRAPLKELPDAFNFQVSGEETFNGRPVFVIDGMPRPGYKPKRASLAFLPKVKARFWIDRTDMQWVKIDMETLDTISYGGVLLRLAKGSHLTIEQNRVNNEVWLPSHVLLKAAARVMLLVGVREEIEFTFRDYKKFQADSHLMITGQEMR